MKIKAFLIIIYTVAGLLISTLTAFMTFLIIGEPIGSKMFFKIALTTVFVLPIIGLISYFIGRYLSERFNFIQERLENIKEEKFTQVKSKNIIYEINEINKNMNFLSNQIGTLIIDLKQKNQNLSNLLISMAHDIKTPITILNGYIEEIEDGIIKKDTLPSILKHMKDEVRFLDELTVDMLHFITSMKSNKTREKINLYSLVKDEIFTILPKNKNIEYINNLDKSFIIEFNKIDLKKICLNLLLNAIKHTDNGYIKVETKDKMILFENSGEEIKEEYTEKIFEPFFTISKSKNRKKSGFGLGLSIVKNLSINNDYICSLHESNKKVTTFCLKKIDLPIFNNKKDIIQKF